MPQVIIRIFVIVMVSLVSSRAWASETYELRPKLVEGKSQYIEKTADMSQEFSANAMFNQTIKSCEGVVETIHAVNDDGMTIAISYDRRMLSVGVMGQSHSIDTDTAEPGSPLLQPIAAMVGKVLELNMTPKLAPKSVSGLEKIRAAVIEEGKKNIMAKQVADNVASALTNERMLREWGESPYEFIPDAPVEVGATWEKTRSVEAGPFGNVESKTTYTLKEVKEIEHLGKQRRVAVIEFKATSSPKGEQQPTAKTPVLKSGEQTGMIYFDLKRSRVISRTSTLNSELKALLPTGQASDMKLSGTETETCMPVKHRTKQREKANSKAS